MLPVFPIAKLTAQVATGLGVSKIVGDIVKSNVTVSTPVQAATVRIGTFVLGSMLWDASANHIATFVDELQSKLGKSKTETPEETSL